jgi:NADH dehydrogenase FAD-containing subunit
MGCNASTDAH